MDYVLKSSAIIIIFFVCYKLFLQRETFFVGNRWFLLSGIILSLIIPLIVIPVYVEFTPNYLDYVSTNGQDASSLQQIEESFNLLQFATILYVTGVLFFIGKLILECVSLVFLMKRNQSKKIGFYTYVETNSNSAPFSFFKWIIYNPNQFDKNELNLILNHEKVHARQYHSMDVIFAQLMCVVFWMNPLIWLYKRELHQNLEFIADREAQNNAVCEINYQKLLLKTTLSNHQLAFANNFYNSLIKNRIIMLHRSKSNKMNAYKYALVIPLLMLFVFNFNTQIIAQTKTSQPDKEKIGQNILKYVITKDTKDKQLESIKDKMAEQDVKLVYKNLKRNSNKEITAIRIEYDSKKGSGEFFVNSDEPINDIAVTLNVNENSISVGQAMKNLSQSFEIITEDGNKKVKTSGSGNNVFVFSTDDDENDDENVFVIGKDGENHEVKKEKNVYVIKSASVKDSDASEDVIFMKKNKKDTVWIKKDVKNIVWTDDDGKDVEIITVENGNKNNIKIFTSGEEQPLILLDGKEITKKDMEELEPENIDSVNVLKGDKAIKKHGKKAEHGVIEITLKKKN
jgi:bla regulator protein BlaR1